MLRDLLVRLEGAGTWPCDEINYIWRHGNIRYPSDAFRREMARPAVKRYVQRRFTDLATSNGLDTIIEKTCANSLRVPFVDEIVRDAKYIFILRDGIDAVASAFTRWHAKMDLPYLLRKARFVPISDGPYYAARFLINHLHRLSSPDQRSSVWGPIIDQMAELQKVHSVIEICALQWQACVVKAEKGFQKLPGNRVIRVRYEEFVDNPQKEYSRIAAFIGKDVPDSMNDHLLQNVRASSIGRGRSELSDEELDLLLPLIRPTLADYSYD